MDDDDCHNINQLRKEATGAVTRFMDCLDLLWQFPSYRERNHFPYHQGNVAVSALLQDTSVTHFKCGIIQSNTHYWKCLMMGAEQGHLSTWSLISMLLMCQIKSSPCSRSFRQSSDSGYVPQSLWCSRFGLCRDPHHHLQTLLLATPPPHTGPCGTLAFPNIGTSFSLHIHTSKLHRPSHGQCQLIYP